jgi:D-cysteine desulfhydrase family pyridoxal phosphate-dependent enzyme
MRLDQFPRFQLTTTPTPLTRAHNLERAIGSTSPRIFLKRDDLTGLAYGGNKARKLEFLVADALASGATVLVTEGAVQSNHARMTAAAAVLAGLKSTLVLDTRRGAAVVGNLVIDRLLGADVRLVSGKIERSAEMLRVGEELRIAGEVPYLVPTGGSVPLGALGYVACVAEINAQLKELGEAPTRLYFSTSSLGTHAGLVVGAKAFPTSFRPIGIAADGNAADMRVRLRDLAIATAQLIDLDLSVDDSDLVIEDAFTGPGYAIPTPECLDAIRLVARTEAVFLDPVYSGKAMAGLLDHIKRGVLSARDTVVFLHTGGGPSIFVHGDELLGG